MTISYDKFEKVDLRSGIVIKVEPFSRARNPSYKNKGGKSNFAII